MPFNEAHGGYTYCGLSTALMFDDWSSIDLPKALNWVANRQMTKEGGFQGRCNKLVDSCYSFWLAGSFD